MPEKGASSRKPQKNRFVNDDGKFGEEFGDDRGYGRLGSHIEPAGHEQVPGEEYTRQMEMSEYTDIVLDEEQGRQREERRWERDDERIYSETAQSLARENLLSTGKIILVVERGEVTLTGVVESQKAREAAAAAVNRVVGVTGVNNQLDVHGENRASQ